MPVPIIILHIYHTCIEQRKTCFPGTAHSFSRGKCTKLVFRQTERNWDNASMKCKTLLYARMWLVQHSKQCAENKESSFIFMDVKVLVNFKMNLYNLNHRKHLLLQRIIHYLLRWKYLRKLCSKKIIQSPCFKLLEVKLKKRFTVLLPKFHSFSWNKPKHIFICCLHFFQFKTFKRRQKWSDEENSKYAVKELSTYFTEIGNKRRRDRS